VIDNELLEQLSQRRVFQAVIYESRLLFRRHHVVNGMSDFAQHARTEGAVAQAGDDVADAFTFL
jgi:hypothetical protein